MSFSPDPPKEVPLLKLWRKVSTFLDPTSYESGKSVGIVIGGPSGFFSCITARESSSSGSQILSNMRRQQALLKFPILVSHCAILILLWVLFGGSGGRALHS